MKGEILAAPFVHALGQLNCVESVCAQHARGGRRPVRGLADRNDGRRAIEIQVRQLPPDGLDRDIHRVSTTATSQAKDAACGFCTVIQKWNQGLSQPGWPSASPMMVSM